MTTKHTATVTADGHTATATGVTRDQARVALQRAWSAHYRAKRGRTWRWIDVADNASITRR